jgi:NAD kinase
MASPEHRLAMCEAAAREMRGVRVSDFEIKHRFLGETYHLARRILADEEIQSRFVAYMIFRQDSVQSMHAWSNIEGLGRTMPTIVIPHSQLAAPPTDAWYRKEPNRYLEASAARFSASSTDVRRRLTSGDPSAAAWIPEAVWHYIQRHQLYPSSGAAHPQRGHGVDQRRHAVAVMIGSFDPPTTAQVRLVETLLSSGFDKVKIFPSARVRGGLVIEHADPVHRAALIDLTFGGRPRVEIDFRGLEDEHAVSPAALSRSLDSDSDFWFVIGEDDVAGVTSATDLRVCWREGQRLWQQAAFIIVTEPGRTELPSDLPVRYQHVPLADIRQPHELRQQLAHGIDVMDCIPSVAAQYIQRHRLFQSIRTATQWPVRWDKPRVRLVFDSRNARATKIAEKYSRWEGSEADVILVIGGDGTMLHAIREYWRLRLPFIGINAGHLGFLMNQQPFQSLDGLEVVSYRMPMLRTVVESASGDVQNHVAFSDAWIERQTGQAAWFRLDIDGQNCLPKVVGDGLLVATPSGSSSYARAMGATPVPLDTQSLTIAGSNIFRPRFWRSLMMPADAEIQITSLDNTGKRPVLAFVDGVPAGLAKSIQVSRSRVAAVELAFAKDSDLSAKLLASLIPSEPDQF